MNLLFYPAIQVVLLVLALSTDTFVAAVSYGADRIRIPFASACLVSGICSGTLALSLGLGQVAAPLLPPGVTRLLRVGILLVLGCVKLFDATVKSMIQKHRDLRKEITVHLFHLRVILNIYADPREADRDRSRVLSAREAAVLAAALSLDGLTVGFGAGLSSIPLTQAAFFSFLLGLAAVYIGSALGRGVAEHTSLNLSPLSGVLLILLAALKW